MDFLSILDFSMFCFCIEMTKKKKWKKNLYHKQWQVGCRDESIELNEMNRAKIVHIHKE